jgi:hypothetical protein
METDDGTEVCLLISVPFHLLYAPRTIAIGWRGRSVSCASYLFHSRLFSSLSFAAQWAAYCTSHVSSFPAAAHCCSWLRSAASFSARYSAYAASQRSVSPPPHLPRDLFCEFVGNARVTADRLTLEDTCTMQCTYYNTTYYCAKPLL